MSCFMIDFILSFTVQLPRRRGEYLFGVAPCLASLRTGRRQIYNIFLKTAVGARTGELKRSEPKHDPLYQLSQSGVVFSI